MGPRIIASHENALEATTSSQQGNTKHIGVALFNGFALPDVASLIEVFQSANALSDPDQSGRPHYEVSLLSASGGRIASSSSVFIWTDGVGSLRRDDHFHALFIAGGIGATTAFRDDRLIVWLRRVFAGTTLVHAIAEGRLLLDAAGLTGAKSTRTDERHYTDARGAGGAIDHSLSPLQIALRLVEQDIGSDIARQVAQWVAPRQKLEPETTIRARPAPHVSEQIQASADDHSCKARAACQRTDSGVREMAGSQRDAPRLHRSGSADRGNERAEFPAALQERDGRDAFRLSSARTARNELQVAHEYELAGRQDCAPLRNWQRWTPRQTLPQASFDDTDRIPHDKARPQQTLMSRQAAS